MRLVIVIHCLFNSCLFFAADSFAAEQADILPGARDSLLLDIATTGSLTVIVGERGHILYRNDDADWQQAKVNTRVMLTAVYLLDEQTGWAVGHESVIVKTEDGGRNWQQVHHDAEDEAPLLDIHFTSASQGIAVGAYGLYYITDDGGHHWQKTDIRISNAAEIDPGFEDFFDLHLNAIEAADSGRLFIAAEAGFVLRSDDAGITWKLFETPYPGSWFGVLPLTSEDVLVYGLRGNLFRSHDGGAGWHQVETGVNSLLTNARQIDQHIVITGLGGTLLVSNDNASSFLNIALPSRDGIAALCCLQTNDLLVVGEKGISKLDPRVTFRQAPVVP